MTSKKTVKQENKEYSDLLLEIGTEELPTKAVKLLSTAMKNLITKELEKNNLNFCSIQPFATPRRLALIINSLQVKQEDHTIERRGPGLKAAVDSNNNFTKAAIGFATSCQTTPEKLETLETEKGSWLVFKQNIKGQTTEELLPEILNNILKKLPIAKPMRWGAHEFAFARPIHWLALIFGNKTVNLELLGIKSSNKTYGHRFMSPKAITIDKISNYESILKKNYVIADFPKRLDSIKKQVVDLAKTVNLTPILSESLLEEVTSLVEWPVALMGNFDKKFLSVPQECLITTMVNNQKYFALTNNKNKIQQNFIFISNIKSKNKKQVINGNERVLTARLSDAEFFFNNDKKQPLLSKTSLLEKITYQQKLGSVLDKSNRVSILSQFIANTLEKNNDYKVDINSLKKAALLSKADLCTEMVFEFPELQGIMGKYYALDTEDNLVADCIEQHYLPKHAGDILPNTIEASILAISDKLDTISGIFAINQKPTGEKDPFGLRRAALGLLRVLIENKIPLDLKLLFNKAVDNIIKINEFKKIANLNTEQKNTLVSECTDFCFDRLKKYYNDQNISINLYYSVINTKTSSPYDFNQRILAVNNFLSLPESTSLIAANKRVKNILNKQKSNNLPEIINSDFLKEPAEINLNNRLLDQNTKLGPLFKDKQYNNILTSLSMLQEPIDSFFDSVMVMDKDDNLKNNRLLLLKNIQALFNKVADISELQQ